MKMSTFSTWLGQKEREFFVRNEKHCKKISSCNQLSINHVDLEYFVNYRVILELHL